jgi:hypothetical protein
MTIAQIVDLTKGELISSPSISKIETIKINPSKIERGDLFIHSPFYNDLTQALSKGAYGVITSQKITPLDNEIAWIVVQDVEEAILRLLRYQLLQQNITFFHLPQSTYTILKNFNNDKSVLFIDESIYWYVEMLFNQKHLAYIIGFNKALLNALSSNIEEFIFDNALDTISPSNSLFISNINHQESHISYRYHSILSQIFNFKIKKNLVFKIIKPVAQHFEPIFINKDFEMIPFGSSERVIILDTYYDEAYMGESILFLNERAKWITKSFYLPVMPVHDREKSFQYTSYKSIKNLKEKLLQDTSLMSIIFIKTDTLFDKEKFFTQSYSLTQQSLF